MTRHQHTVLGAHEIGLDEVGAHLHRQCVALERMLRAMSAGATMGDHQWGRSGLPKGWLWHPRR